VSLGSLGEGLVEGLAIELLLLAQRIEYQLGRDLQIERVMAGDVEDRPQVILRRWCDSGRCKWPVRSSIAADSDSPQSWTLVNTL